MAQRYCLRLMELIAFDGLELRAELVAGLFRHQLCPRVVAALAKARWIDSWRAFARALKNAPVVRVPAGGGLQTLFLA